MKENPRFKDENVYALRFPEKDQVVCKDCVFRAKDIADGEVSGAVLGCCEAYEIKPPSILLDGKDCIYYLSENEDTEE